MFQPQSDKPEGYEYPRPSIDRGQTQVPLTAPAVPLSRENAERLSKSVQEGVGQPPKAPPSR